MELARSSLPSLPSHAVALSSGCGIRLPAWVRLHDPPAFFFAQSFATTADSPSCQLPAWVSQHFGTHAAKISPLNAADALDSVTADTESTAAATSRLSITLRPLLPRPWVPTSRGLEQARSADDNPKHTVFSSALSNPLHSPLDCCDWSRLFGRSLHGKPISIGIVVPIWIRGQHIPFLVEQASVQSSEACSVAVEYPRYCIANSRQIQVAVVAPSRMVSERAGVVGTSDFWRLGLDPLHYSPKIYPRQISELHKVLESTFSLASSFKTMDMVPPQWILVRGPPGTGKSQAISYVLNRLSSVPAFSTDILDTIVSLKDAEQSGVDPQSLVTPLLRSVEMARLSSPAVVVVHSIDLLSQDSNVDFDLGLLSAHVDAVYKIVQRDHRICFVSECDKSFKLPKKLAHAAGFHTIDIPIPTLDQRKELLAIFIATQAASMGLSVDEAAVQGFSASLAQRTTSYTASDLKNFVDRSLQSAFLRKHKSKEAEPQRSHTTTPTEVDEVLASDFDQTHEILGPREDDSELSLAKPKLSWDAVGGYKSIKEQLIRLTTWPIERPDAYQRLGVKPPGGILLYGPTGCGKTTLVKALASNCSLNFIAVKNNQIFNKYLGESEASIRRIFASARRFAPCIIFFDEFDTIGTKRDWQDDGTTGVNERILSTLLNEMDGVSERTGVLVVACTNRPEQLDDALLRPGRLDHLIYVGLPRLKDRREILAAIGRSGAQIDGKVDLNQVAAQTKGFSSADLSVLLREAGMLSMRESAGGGMICSRHIAAALEGAHVGRLDRSSSNLPKTQAASVQSVTRQLANLGRSDSDEWVSTDDDGDNDSGNEADSSEATASATAPVGARPLSQARWWKPRMVSRMDLERFQKFRRGHEE
ncbi:uncharacterized protein BJ171DRAFT_523060 [Polychytrium aggregatum]|uniref:uncharacterized protein n=1 Tax=Polychytrium aggregatum TaxID=110093 RepID=UPI0022FED155|nr:uncharacterized protein BJ171DRAFT_523060 [Polychytrium aggregatum]KAI9197081.1 hypothetical protein BJ171DRAFT_523060 [Polychytrium aggregatum]